MPQFLLIHGGAHGAWCWEPVIAELEKRGHRAVAFDLPGHGDDPTPRASVNLRAYVGRITEFLRGDDSGLWTLVGHSLAGTVLPEVAVTFPEKVETVIYLAAFALKKGEASINYTLPERRKLFYELAANSEDNSLPLDYEACRRLYFATLSEDEARRAFARLTPQPFAVFTDAVEVGVESIPCHRRYLAGVQDLVIPAERSQLFAERLGVPMETVDTGHDAMLTAPEALARMLAG